MKRKAGSVFTDAYKNAWAPSALEIFGKELRSDLAEGLTCDTTN